MTFLQQIIELLSRPPGSVIFHLLTLFALQVVLALTFARWRQDADDESARRGMIAAGGILAVRLLVLLVGMAVGGNPEQARALLPPLEQAVDTATVILLVWGLVPLFPDRPRLADAVLIGSLVLVAVVFLFFLQDWLGRMAQAATYNSTTQAVIWVGIQIAILLAGVVWLVVDRRSRLTLRPFVVGVPLLAHFLHYWNYPEIVPSGTEVAYWVRLGYLIAFPLWAVLVYHENLNNLTTVAEAEKNASNQLMRTLRLSTGVISAPALAQRLEQSLDMVAGLTTTRFVAVGLIDEKNPARVLFNHARPMPGKDVAHGWRIDLTDRSALRLAFEQQRGIELLPRGVGARQAHELSQAFGISPVGPLFVEPLVIGEKCVGFLLLAAPEKAESWSDRDRAVIPAAAAFVTQAIANVRRLEDETPARLAFAGEGPLLREAVAEAQRLSAETAELRRSLAAAEERAQRAEAAAAEANQAAEQAMQHTPVDPQAGASVGAAVENAVGAILPQLRRKRLQLDIALGRDLPPVAVRPEILQQLVLSLLDNACRASSEESWMMVRADAGANGSGFGRGRLTISVTDSGRGIRPDDQERVFDSQYYLLGGPPIAGLGDNGANLAVVQKLAQASGGNISFESIPGTGSTFKLRLPVAAPADEGAPETASQSAETDVAGSAVPA